MNTQKDRELAAVDLLAQVRDIGGSATDLFIKMVEGAGVEIRGHLRAPFTARDSRAEKSRPSSSYRRRGHIRVPPRSPKPPTIARGAHHRRQRRQAHSNGNSRR